MFVETATELYASSRPSAEIVGCATSEAGVTIASGAPRALPLSSSIAMRHRFMVPDRSLKK